MKRWGRPLLAATTVILIASALAAASAAPAGRSAPTLSFFSGGGGAHADWLVTDDQPPGDTDSQAIRLLTTNGAPSYAHGYAGILFHHVAGIPTAAFPDSEFWVKTPSFTGASLGSPRLVVEFQDAAGNFVGYGDLRPLGLTPTWQDVNAKTDPINAGWDVMGGPCGFRYQTQWEVVQSCFAGDAVLSVFIVADAYGIYHLIDDITVNNKTFSSASDNANGFNAPAGPDATTDPSLLPAIVFPPS
jgi:hypothetical protein